MGKMLCELTCSKHSQRAHVGLVAWHAYGVAFDSLRWLTVPDLVDALNLSPGKVHRLLEDRHLLAVRRERVLVVPEEFIYDGAPVTDLRGTLIVLADNGFTNDEAMSWMLSTNDLLGVSPIEALRSGRKAEVRRTAQSLAF